MSERDMKKLVALIARRIGLQYTDVVDWLREQNPTSAIEERIIRGSAFGAIDKLDDAAKMLASEIHESYVTSGQEAAKWLDAKIADKLVRFDVADTYVTRRARANELELVQGFREEQYQVARQITQRAMIEGAQGGVNPRRVAQDFRDSIGLTPSQEQHVANYRRSLEQGDFARALGYELSSGQADRTIRSVRAKDGALTPAQIDDFTERYRANYVTHRATTIARTEALRNANAGVGDAIEQAITRGEVDAGLLVKTWHARGGPRGRDTHTAMDEVAVGVREDFVLPDGTRMSRPGDPRGGAENNVNCGCTASTSFA